MKAIKMLFIAMLCVTIGTVGSVITASAQTYFADNFDNPTESQKRWVPLYGQWEFKDKEYHQLANAINCMSVVADEYWDDGWNDYTYELRANKISGAEGFLIMFRCMGKMQDRGVVLKAHPPRMEKQSSLQYWWNLGGWANTRSQVESWGGKAGANSADTINTGEWYDIKIVNTPKDYTLYLNGKKVATVEDSTQDGKGRIGLATWSTVARFDNVVVYGPKGPSQVTAVNLKGKATTTWAQIKSALPK